MIDIDLHMHSTCSDGLLEPEELVNAAGRAGLGVIALCDHDSIAGVARAMAAGRARGVEVLTGVELSVAWQNWRDVHLLGYGIDLASPELLRCLATFAERRANRNREIVAAVNRRLDHEGRQPLDPDDVTALAGGVMGRPHIARALMARAYVASMEEAFDRYLVPCDVPKTYWPMEEAIAAIRRAGGAAVLAHPTSISTDFTVLERLVGGLAAIGLDGVEVYNSMASEAEAAFLQGLTRRHRLVTTAGSDFHGIDPDDTMGKGRGGIRFSGALLPPLYARIAERQEPL